MQSVPDETVRSNSSPDETSASAIITQYLSENSQSFRELTKLRAKGWQTIEGDRFFEHRRYQSDNVSREQARSFYAMTCQIGDELDKETSIIKLATTRKGQPPRVLDMGMAPGGFTATVLRKHPAAIIRGITLSQDIGGLEVMIPRWRANARIQIKLADVTMLTDEMGHPAMTIPNTHPDHARFSSDRPFPNEEFDLIFCGAAVQRAHDRAEYRESRERLRLVTSQLIVAFQHLRDNGSLVVLMYKPEALDTTKIINMFSKFSKVRLFKPRKKHAVRSSFYMVAKEVRPRCEEAQSAILEWKSQWENATFNFDGAQSILPRITEDGVRDLLAEFGPQLIKLATPVWKIQRHGLRSSSFIKDIDDRKNSGKTQMR